MVRHCWPFVVCCLLFVRVACCVRCVGSLSVVCCSLRVVGCSCCLLRGVRCVLLLFY